MTPFALLLIPALIGSLALIAILQGVPLKHKGLFLLGASLPTGLGLISLIVFAAFLIMPSAGKTLSMLGVMFLFAASLIQSIHRTPSGSRTQLFSNLQRSIAKMPGLSRKVNLTDILKTAIVLGSLLILLVSLYKALQFQSLVLPSQIFGGWDARYIWTLKAQFMFQSPTDWQLLFSPKLPWAHPDYPLLLPNSIAWGWQLLGSKSLLWGPAVALGFYFSCAFLLVWYIAEHVSLAAGGIAGAFFSILAPYGFWTLQQYADVPVAFFLGAGGLSLVTALRSGEKKFFALSGLMAGLAAWTKNEGVLFVVWMNLVLAGVCLKRYRERTPKSFEPLIYAVLGAALPLAAVILLKIFLGTSGDDFESKRTFTNYVHFFTSGGSRLSTTLKAFWTHTVLSSAWKNLWGFFLLAGCLLLFKAAPRENKYGWVLCLSVLLINLGYFLAIYVTPYDLEWQIQTALSRLILHSGILAIAFVFEILTFQKPLKK